MSRKRFTTERIITMLREAELLSNQGKSIKEIARGLGITEQTYYRWRKDYGGLRMDYNTERPHSSLNNMTPEEFALKNGASMAEEQASA